MEVVKLGGASGVELKPFCGDMAGVRGEEPQLVLVHGGSHAVNTISTRLGNPPRILRSPSGHESRYTDAATLEIFTMVCAGKVNKELVQLLQGVGVNALGLSGLDGALVVARRKKAVRTIEEGKVKVVRDDYSGIITRVNTGLIQILLAEGYLPVIGPPALSQDGTALNVDADRLAGAIAVELGATRLIFLSNVPGFLQDPDREESMIPFIPKEELDQYRPLAKGRMGKKLLAAGEALAGGVKEVILGDARGENPLSRARRGEGTVIK